MHLFTHPFINPFKYVSSAYYVPCIILCAGYIAVSKTKSSCLHESYLFVVHSNDIQINAHYNEDSDRFYEEKIKQIKGMGNLKYSDQVRLLQGSDFWRDGENSKKWKWDMYVLHQSYTEIVYLSFNMSLMYVGLYIKYGSMLDIC